MTDPAALLLGADVTRLYRKLESTGIQLAAVDEQLDPIFTGSLCRLALRLIRCALAQNAPDIVLDYDRGWRQFYYIPAPELSWHIIFHPQTGTQITRHLESYSEYPFFAHINTALSCNSMSLTFGAAMPSEI